MKKFLAVVISFAMLTSMAACGSNPPPVPEPSAPVPAAPSTPDAPAPEPPAPIDDTVIVGVSMPTRTVERWVYEGDLMESELRRAGFEVILQFANDDPAVQLNQVENMVASGAKFLIICPVDGSSLSAPLTQLRAQGGHVLAYDRLIMDTVDVDYFVGFNSEKIGNHMGNSLMTGIGAANATADNPLYIEMFAGSLDDSNTTYYFHGAKDMIQPYLDAGAVVVKSGQVTMEQCATPGWDSERAMSRMENLLSAHYTNDTLAGALSPYDGLSLGIISAMRAAGYGTAGRPMPIVTGQDAELPSLVSIWNDEQYSTIYLDFDLLVTTATDATRDILNGNPPAQTKTYNNNVIDVPSFLADAFELTKENLKQFFPDFEG